MQKQKDPEENPENTLPEGTFHKSVLLEEVIKAFGLEDAHLNKGKKIIDATLGLGGHTLEFIKRGANVLGLDHDREMLELAERRLMLACPIPNDENWGSFKLINASFRKIAEISLKEGFTDCDGILFDLGVSSPQITSQERGFSFQNDQSHLDMRMDRENGSVKGSDLLNLLREDQLNLMLSQVMDRGVSRRLAREITRYREFKPFETVGDYKSVIEKVIKRRGKTHFATKPFLALRIAVNSEIENIKETIPQAVKLLKKGGRLAVITFNSLEDHTVKVLFKELTEDGELMIINKDPIEPTLEETEDNKRARSAKLRIAEKI